jgi:pimeloyl-ACP methyl ester carboxylesterase
MFGGGKWATLTALFISRQGGVAMTTNVHSLKRARLGTAEIEYEERGSGDAVMLIHGSHVADSYLPIMSEPSLAGYRLIRPHRRGFAGSTRAAIGTRVSDWADDCLALLDAAGAESAHFVGHSYGGVIVLELMAMAPRRVRSAVLMEPGLLLLAPSANAFMDSAAPVFAAYQAGDKAGAVRIFQQAIQPDALEVLARLIPGGYEQAVRDADTFFQIEVPALQAWRPAESLATYSGPVLHMMGSKTWPIFFEVRDIVHRFLPQTEDAMLETTHFHQEDPSATAATIASFLART